MTEAPHVLLLLKPSPAREALSEALGEDGFQVDSTASVFSGVAALAKSSGDIGTLIDVVVFGLDDVVEEEMEAIKVIRQDCPDSFIVVTFSPVNRRKARAAMELGADAYVLEPLNVEEVRSLLARYRPVKGRDPNGTLRPGRTPAARETSEPERTDTTEKETSDETAGAPTRDFTTQQQTSPDPSTFRPWIPPTVGPPAQPSDPALDLEYAPDTSRLVSLRKLGASVAHEINNPLTTLSGWIQLLLRKVNGNRDLHRTLLSMKEETDRIADVVRELTAISEPQLSGRQTVGLNELASDVIECFQATNGNVNIQVKTVLANVPGQVNVDVDLAVRAVCDLLNCRYLELGNSGSLVFQTCVRDGFAQLNVYEPGSQTDLQPFHKVLASLDLEEGNTLGADPSLARAFSILDSHQVRFEAECDIREGLSIVVKFPLAE